ncbi:hypothetical protein K461DRAFT_276671 [Myriangium duriaei CBS 260.36]|uniref:N-acetyltransferase domain-containing protein n=1 Tax=Myriangium duriaei CBS 260.36 TaxID=1168546 RepID=A0A9P4J4W7_9PEZI|nr:hypothetical protein K461DRAFT_276671 [Myriangium duriaei CBS 260.36]
MDLFASKQLYWAKALPESAMREMLGNSLCFGLYELSPITSTTTKQHKFVGTARCVTDCITFFYLTDVWVESDYQGRGLGAWMIRCVHEVINSMPHLRRSLLFTGDWERSVPFYERHLDMELFNQSTGQGLAIMERKGPGHPSYGEAGSGYN